MYRLQILVLLSIITLAFVSVSKAQSLEKLTPVDNPFEFQNEYYPITFGNYWKMFFLSMENGGNTELKGHYEYRITDYTFEEIYFGDSLIFVPIFQKESKFFRPESNDYEIISISYLIKTNEGVIECLKPPIEKRIKPYVFIPTNSSYDYLSYVLTGFTIDRNVDLKTRYWEMNTIRINYKDKQNIGGFFYCKDKGHVYTQFFYKKMPSQFQTNFQETEKYEPGSEFILSEFKIE